VLMAAIGVFYNPLMILIGVVVWMGASQERALVHLHAALHGVPVSAAMLTRVRVVAPEDSLGHAAALLLDGRNELPVIDHGEPVGVLTRDDVAVGLSSVGPDAPVSDAPHHDAVTVEPGEPLDLVLDRLRQRAASAAVVVDHGIAVGIVTADALTNYAAMHSAGH
jgi:predicted transcriptional regulator